MWGEKNFKQIQYKKYFSVGEKKIVTNSHSISGGKNFQ